MSKGDFGEPDHVPSYEVSIDLSLRQQWKGSIDFVAETSWRRRRWLRDDDDEEEKEEEERLAEWKEVKMPMKATDSLNILVGIYFNNVE